MTTPDGITISYQYDAHNLVTQMTDNLNQATRYSYDAHKNLIRTETTNSDDSLALVAEQSYDSRNRLLTSRMPHQQQGDAVTEYSITQIVLDENSNLIESIDPNGSPSGTSYDAFNRVSTNTHREGGVTYCEYDAQDRIIKITAPNSVITSY